MVQRILLNNLPNLITLGRLGLTPVAISMIVSQRYVEAFAAFLVAGISDAVDGFIAKRFAMTSELGAYLDPLADKALLISIYVSLAIVGQIWATLAIAVVSRDIMIVSGVVIAWLLEKPMEIRPVWASKVNTFAQISFAGATLGARAFSLTFDWALTALGIAVFVTTIVSTVIYIAQWLAHMSR
jgi:cardiolipin synthase (CMP-forming)